MDGIRLWVNWDAAAPVTAERLAGSDGLVVTAAGALAPPDTWPAPVAVLCGADPEALPAWRERPGLAWVADGGVEEVARLREQFPELAWVPRLTAYRPEVRYDFPRRYNEEGFSFYVPDTATVHGYRTAPGGLALGPVLERARSLGFETLWLHSRLAEQRARGFDLELVEQAGEVFRGRLWLSGGGTDERHLVNLAREGGVAAVAVAPGLCGACGGERLRLALASGAETGVPVRFAAGRGEEPPAVHG